LLHFFTQENDDFFELISLKFLSENGYSTAVRAASVRLLLCCSLTWIVRLFFPLVLVGFCDFFYRVFVILRVLVSHEFDEFLIGQYPHVFEEPVLENLNNWATEDSSRSAVEEQNLKRDPVGKDASDSEMLKAYSTGLLAVCLVGYAMLLHR
jgi:DDB1- and CUL4-associated factor 1